MEEYSRRYTKYVSHNFTTIDDWITRRVKTTAAGTEKMKRLHGMAIFNVDTIVALGR